MNDSDRALAELLQRTAPEPPRTIDFDAVTGVARRRRTTTAIAGGAGAVLAIVAVFTTLAQMGPHPTPGDSTPIATSEDDPTGDAEYPGCPPTRPYPNGMHVDVDHVPFIVLGGRAFIAPLRPEEEGRPLFRDDLGPQIRTVSCRIADLTEDGREEVVGQFPGDYPDGNAAYLKVGTPIYAVKGFDPACRLAVIEEDKIVPYLAHHEVNNKSVPLDCAMTPANANKEAKEWADSPAGLMGTLQWVGGPAPGTAEPHPGTIHVVSTDGTIDQTAEAGTDGAWRMDLPPGTYTVRATSPGYLSKGGAADACSPAADPVTVEDGKPTRVEVYCQLK